MNVLDKQLVIFSWIAIIVFSSMIIFPTLKRRRELFSYWNLFLLGAVLFNGLSGLGAAAKGANQGQYVDLDSMDYYLYYIGVLIFYSSFLIGYCVMKYPRKLAGKTFLKWPPVNAASMIFVAVLSLLLASFFLSPIPIPFLGIVLRQIGPKAPAISMAFAFVYWTRNRSNPLAFTILLVALATALYTASTVTSRRFLIDALIVLPAVTYWVWIRKKSIFKVFVLIVIGAVITVPILRGYTAVRHSKQLKGKRGVEHAVTMLQMLPQAIMRGGSSEGSTGQDSVEVGLTLINCLRTDSLEEVQVTPFAVVRFIASNPIPRIFWEEKPESLGQILPRSLGRWRYGYVNWGVNICAQCYYDGGIPIHILYGLLFGMLFRYLDEMLVRKSGNPFMMALFCTNASQILAMARGSIDVFMMQVIAGMLAVLLIAFLTKLFFGVAHIDPRTDHIDDAWQAEETTKASIWTIVAQQNLFKRQSQLRD